MQSTGNRGYQQVTKVCGCCWFWCNLQQSHPNGFYDAGSASTEAYRTHLLLLAVLLVRRSLNNVPCHLVPFKQLLQRTCSQVKLQTVFIQVLQGHCVGLPVFTILHYKKEDKEAQWCLTLQTLRNQDLVDVYTNPNAVMTHSELKPQKNAQDWTKQDDAAV